MEALTKEAIGQIRERLSLPLQLRQKNLEVRLQGQKVRFRTYVEPQLTGSKSSLLAHELSRDNVVITEHITSSAARLLRNRGIGYIDRVGNCFLQQRGLYVLIEDQKGYGKSHRVRPNRAFKKSGIKIIFLLLQETDSLNLPYREIAEIADVSHGTVRYVIKDLEELGYIETTSKGERLLNRKSELTKRWAERYGEVLRPQLLRGRYQFRDPSLKSEWKSIKLTPENSLWGGEPAADLITEMIRPKVFTLYTREETSRLMKTLRAIPEADGNIEIIDIFWKSHSFQPALSAGNQNAVPPLLVYADLISSAEPRNVEVADLIYERFLSNR